MTLAGPVRKRRARSLLALHGPEPQPSGKRNRSAGFLAGAFPAPLTVAAMLRFAPLRAFLSNLLLLAVVAFALVRSATAQADRERAYPKTLIATPAIGEIAVDGHLDDPGWQSVTWTSDFVQLEPVEGGAPSSRTEVAFRFSDEALYIGARMYSDNPAEINALVTRRDVESNAEQLLVSLDTYLNRRTAYAFGVTAGGARIDYFLEGDSRGDPDYSFDPVWSAASRLGHDGWTAEMRIPFSQLRFNEQGEQTWGLNINRRIPAASEDVYWVMVPRESAGWASRFGALSGIKDIRPSRRVELLPYVAAGGVAVGDRNPANPFVSSFDQSGRAGLDAKIGLGPNMTLDVTVNPDFGQVEADPAEVNLTAFETFFSERRPFFAEGADLLSGSLFYSRRIGARPRGFASGDFVDQPEATTILGATKLSGRLPGGLSIAALGAATQAEFADTYDVSSATFGRARVEPFATYAAAALQQEFGSQGSVIGIRATAVNRSLDQDDTLSESLNSSAYAGQVNWNVRFDGGAYVVDGGLGFTRVNGTAPRIARLQRSPVHYFHRPDADYLTYDPSKTAMTGVNADLFVGKNSGQWTGGTFVALESPGLDPNDLGRLGRADELAWYTEVGYRETRPGRFVHRYSAEIASFSSWNLGGQLNTTGADASVSVTWKNYWRTEMSVGYNPTTGSDTATRGGPRMRVAGERNIVLELGSNPADKLSASVFAYHEVDELERSDYRFGVGIDWQPSERLDLSFQPGYARLLANRQYVATLDGGPDETFGSRYVFSLIDRTQVSARLRLNYTVRPDFTIEIYLEPFAASGAFYRFGELETAGGIQLRQYGDDEASTIAATEDGYQVTDGAQTFSLPDRDFNITSLRSNALVRWEWRPGSTLYLVWQQNRSGSSRTGTFVSGQSLSNAFSAVGDNYFRLKISYWFPVD